MKRVMGKNVCHNIESEIKLAFCREFLDIDANGFRLASSTDTQFTCTDQVHQVFLKTRQEYIDQSTWHGFYCPQITYTDLETDEEISLPYIYKITTAKKCTEALFFVQEGLGPAILNPQYYVKKINFYRYFGYRLAILWIWIGPSTPARRKSLQVTNF